MILFDFEKIPQLFGPFFLDRLRHLILHPGRRCSGPGRIWEHMPSGEAQAFDEGKGLRKFIIGLSRETGDDIRRYRKIRIDGKRGLHQ